MSEKYMTFQGEQLQTKLSHITYLLERGPIILSVTMWKYSTTLPISFRVILGPLTGAD